MDSRRGVAARRALITTPHRLATAAGLRVLEQGGNAVEAAIAAAAVIAVVYPHMNAIGGDNFWLVYTGRDQRVRALMACGAAGAECTIEAYRAAGHGDEIPRRGPLAVNTVPGAVDGWWQAYELSCQALDGRRTFAALLADAVSYAGDGFPVTRGQEAWTRMNVGPASGPFGHLEEVESFRHTFLRPDGTCYRAGERFVMPGLGSTMAEIARGGRDAFYHGPIAARVCEYLRARGGLLTVEDFGAHRSRWADPIQVAYRGRTVCNTPPPTQGLTSLEILNIIAQFPVATWGDASADYYHTMVEATKQAFVDRGSRHPADPRSGPAVSGAWTRPGCGDRPEPCDTAAAGPDLGPRHDLAGNH